MEWFFFEKIFLREKIFKKLEKLEKLEELGKLEELEEFGKLKKLRNNSLAAYWAGLHWGGRGILLMISA